ncbi:MAG: SDR family oxidoreductase, partial [Clostridia bacterium]
MKILVTGIKGQLGYDVMLEGQRRGYDMVGFDIDTMDITDNEAVNRIFSAEAPDIVIHCAAYTAVDPAEKEREKCCAVNVDGTENVARASARCGAKLIYVSTDYVYDGRGEMPHSVSEKKDPVNYYGLTKSWGEDRVTALCDRYFIVRTSWVF